MTLGNNLKKYREQKKLSQRKLAKKIGIHHVNYYRYEKDKILPSAEIIKKLSLVLEISIDDLILTEKEKNNLRTSNKELLERLDKIDQLSKKNRDSIIYMLDALLNKREINTKKVLIKKK